ncbi:hypothetical protein Tco_1306894, partial [Tanacetum coccineum]
TGESAKSTALGALVTRTGEAKIIGGLNYQKRINITKPETYRSDISKRTPYTAYNNPQGVIYLDKYKINRLMRSDELYKFCDGTLTSVRTVLHDIASNLRMEYLPQRRWSNLDRNRSCILIKAIGKLQLKRRLMRSLEKFVGGRDYGTDLRLLEQTIRLCHILSFHILEPKEMLGIRGFYNLMLLVQVCAATED